MILHYFKKKENEQFSSKYYISIIKFIQNLYEENSYKLKKNFNTSFELTILMIFIFYFSHKDNKFNPTKQEINDLFIEDLDLSFRNLGIGDMKIGKYVKKHVKKIYFRFGKLDKIFIENNYDAFHNYIKKIEIIDDNDNILNKFCKFMFRLLNKHINSLNINTFEGFDISIKNK